MNVKDWFLKMAENNYWYSIPKNLDAEHTRIDFLLSEIMSICCTQRELDLIIAFSCFKNVYELLHFVPIIYKLEYSEKEMRLIKICYRSLERLDLLDKLQLEKMPEKSRMLLNKIIGVV